MVGVQRRLGKALLFLFVKKAHAQRPPHLIRPESDPDQTNLELAQPQRAHKSPGSRTFQSSVGAPMRKVLKNSWAGCHNYERPFPGCGSPRDTVPYHWLLIQVTGAEKCRPKENPMCSDRENGGTFAAWTWD